MLKIYLDTCCFNRPYDDQSLLRNSLEAQAVSRVQFLVQAGRFLLVTSYVLLFENSNNPHFMRKTSIDDFIKKYSNVYIGVEHHQTLTKKVQNMLKSGIKNLDAYHVACAQFADCRYFLSTDDRLLKHSSESMKIVNPVDFLRLEVERQ